MATHALADVLRYMRRLVAAEEGDDQGDASLLRRFVARRDEAAFAALLQRHAPRVFGVCRQVLGNPHDAEDAFQATFLVLARKAGSVRRGQSLSAWLYRVALNVARTARARAARRQAREREAALMSEPTTADEAAPPDWQRLLHEEVDRLPEMYRVPVVLCYLEAKTHDEAARQLGWPLGTVKGRLARARDLLRSRLARRGLALSAAALAAAWPAGPATAAVPPALLAATFRAAVSFAWQTAVSPGAASAGAVTLAQGVLRAMSGTTTRLVLLFLLALGAAGAGAVFAARPGDGADAAGPPVRGTPAGAPRADEPQKPRPAEGGPRLTLRSERQEYRPGEPIDLLLGVTNPGKEDFNCLNPPLNVLANLEVTGPGGKKVAPVLNPPAAVATLPERSPLENGFFIVGPGQTAWVSDCLRLVNRAKAETGAYVRRGYFPMGAVGTYRLRIRLGKAASNELVLKVLGNEGLAESPAVRVNEVDFQTVAEEKCPQPAPGGKQPLYLGLRVTNRGDGPLRFNVYDTLRPVLTTADGTAVPLKAGQRLRSFVPAPLLVRPGKTETVLRCPFLERLPGGKALRLRGPDGAGGFWYFNDLRPGKYRVHFEYENAEATQAALLRTLREQAGAGPPFWLGKVTTGAAAFEITRGQKGARRDEGGLRLTLGSDRQEYQPGQAVNLTLAIINNGKEPFSCLRSGLQNLTGLEMTGPDGRPVAFVPNPVEIGFGNAAVTVPAGQTVTVRDELRGINLPRAGTARYIRHTYLPMQTPGNYRLRFRVGEAASNEAKVTILGKRDAGERETEERKENALKRDLKNLVGTWHMVGAEEGGKPLAPGSVNPNDFLSFSGTTFSFKSGKRGLEGAFTIDPSKSPKWLDLKSRGGLVFKGLYALKGDVLRVYLGAPGGPRPAGFKTKEGEKLWVRTYERVKAGHAGRTREVFGVALSADGKHLLAGSADTTAILWETASASQVQTFAGHANCVFSVAVSADGKKVVTGSHDKTVVLWDAANGNILQTFAGHSAEVSSVALSADGKLLTGSWDDTAILWDAATGKKLRTFRGHTGIVTSVALSADGKRVVTGSTDKRAILWDAATGDTLKTFQGHPSCVFSVALSADGKQVVTGSEDRTAILWDVSTGTQVRRLEGHTADVQAVALSADGKHVLTGSRDKTAILWDAATGNVLRIFAGHADQVSSVAWSVDGKQVVTGSYDGTAVLWEAATGKKRQTFRVYAK